MVKGLDNFGEYFKDHHDKYIVIGGTACFLSMNDVGLEFRATKDIDLVLIVEALDDNFIQYFWDFIKKGQYETKEKSTGKRQVYRFINPKKDNFPYMLELFSRKPDVIKSSNNSFDNSTQFTPIPTEDEVSSLSAILRDDSSYEFLKNGTKIIDNIPILKAEYLIPLKMKAWLDLKERKKSSIGKKKIDSKDIKKHKNDVFRLFQIIEPETIIKTPKPILKDITEFITKIQQEPINLKDLGLNNITLEEVLNTLKQIYKS